MARTESSAGAKRPRSHAESADGDGETKRARYTDALSPLLSGEDIKKSAPDFALKTAGIKRSRSSSPSDEDDDVKRLRETSDIPRLVLDDGSDSEGDDGDILTAAQVWQNGTIASNFEFEGVTVRNAFLATVAADGSLETLSTSGALPVSTQTPPATPGPKEKSGDALSRVFTLTPPITPAANQDNRLDPFEQYYEDSKTQAFGNADYTRPPQDFVIIGDIDLFDCTPAKLHIFHGSVSQLHPYSEVVKVSTGEATIGTILPDLKDGPFDAISIHNLELCYASVKLDDYQKEGLYLETDVMFKGPLQPIHDLMKQFFHQERSSLHVSAYLGETRDWTEPETPSDLVLRGSFDNCSIKAWDLVEFTQIGVELSIKHDEDEGREIGYGLFGKAQLPVTGSVVPLQAEYLVRTTREGHTLAMILSDKDWKDCLGISGLTLSEVTFVGVFPSESSETELSLQVGAVLSLGGINFCITGTYAKDNCCLEARVGDLSLLDVGKVFQHITGHQLDAFDHDISFESLSLLLSPDGIALTGRITINDHSTAQGTISVMQDGLCISGDIGDIEFEDLTIKSASFDVFIGSSNGATCSRVTKFGISGELSLSGLDLRVGLFTEKTGSDSYWTIYGEVVGNVSVGSLEESLKGSFLDVSLDGLALIASNKDDPDGPYNKYRYPVHKGIQFCAAIDRIPQLEDLLRGSVKGMVLSASYIDGSLRVGVVLPAERTITFGDNVYTGPLMLEFAKEGVEIQFILKALLNVKVETQPDPLKFSLGLKASCSGAAAYAQMMSDWANPCNVGKNVVVRGCALEFGIVYATFFTTGMPGAIGLAGQLMIGDKEAKVAMKLSQNPKEQVLAAAVKDLGVVDLVKFASVVCEREMPQPDDFLHFGDVQLYLSTGASIGESYYPPGASLKGDMSIFGKKAKFDCTIGSMVKIMATIEHFNLGPLTVKGATGPDPIVDIEISSSKQRVLIDGAVELWALSAALHLEAQVFPEPMFDFWVDVSLSDWFSFKLEAKLTGDIDFTNFDSLAKADFTVHGIVEQHVLEEIVVMLDRQINSMHENSDFEQARQKLCQMENKYNNELCYAQSRLDAATRVWQWKQAQVTESRDRVKSKAATLVQGLQTKVDEAETAYKNAVAQASSKLIRIRHDASIIIRQAESDVCHAQQDLEEGLRQAQDDLHRKRDAFSSTFGSVRADLENARSGVAQATKVAESLCMDMSKLDTRIEQAFAWDLPTLVAEKAARVIEQAAAATALEAVRAVFDTAEAVVKGAEFVGKETEVTDAEDVLREVRQTKSAVVDATIAALKEAQQVQGKMIQEATNTLYAIERSSVEMSALVQAQKNLAEGVSTAHSMTVAAEKELQVLKACAEFLAVGNAQKALVAAQSTIHEVELARQACALVEEDSSSFADDILDVGLNIGKWIASAAADIINITKIEFSGSLSSLVADGPPLVVNIQGRLLDEYIDIDINWQPNFDVAKFVKAIFSELWEMIKEAAGQFLEGIGAKVVEIAEDVVEAVGELAEDIGEGIDDAASAVGHAVDDVVDAVDDAMSDVESVFDDAASEVGHVVDDVAEGVGNALNDVGNAVGDVVCDVGSTVENVVGDIGSALGSIFS